MKTKLNRIDFETWNSWDLPSYTRVVKHVPFERMENGYKTTNETIIILRLIIAVMSATFVILHWDKVMKLYQSIRAILLEEKPLVDQEVTTQIV